MGLKPCTRIRKNSWLIPVWWVVVQSIAWVATCSYAQTLTFSTLAGRGGPGATDGAGVAAGFNSPMAIAADATGNLYVADTGNHTIRKITPAGACTTLAGLSGVAGSSDGTNNTALFNRPSGIAVDVSGTVYVADTGNHTIRKVSALGVVTTLAGSPGTNGTANGSGTGAQFNSPQGVAVDTLGNVYVADTWNHAIRKVTSGGSVSTFAGQAGTFGTNDASGTSARFNQPQGIAINGSGTLYVADSGNQTIRAITSGGAVSTLAGGVLVFGAADGAAGVARFHQPIGLTVDAGGNVYIADFWNQTIRQVTSGGFVSTIAGSATNSGSADGLNSAARFSGPSGLAIASGSLLVADSANGTIRKIKPAGANWIVSTIAGYASAGANDGMQLMAEFHWPAGVAVDSQGNTFVTDSHNQVIRKITPAGLVSTFAGSAGISGATDGLGTAARFNNPQGLDVDASDFLYVADAGNHTIRKISAGGTVSTLAGSAGTAGPLDATGANALFKNPQGLAVDKASGTLYVADTGNHTIRKVTSGGAVTTLAGLAGMSGGSDGTNGKAKFFYPAGIAFSSGSVFVADSFNHTIRQITPAGVVTTIAGMPGDWGAADGTNSNARFLRPQGLAINGSGEIFVMDAGNNTVRKVVGSGNNWVVTTVAGLPGVSGSANGIGSGNRFNQSCGITFDPLGTLYIADAGNNAIRVSRLVQPQLQISRAGSQGSVFWLTSGFGFLPETSGSVQNGWTQVTTNVVTVGDVSVLNTGAATPAFYRLRKP